MVRHWGDTPDPAAPDPTTLGSRSNSSMLVAAVRAVWPPMRLRLVATTAISLFLLLLFLASAFADVESAAALHTEASQPETTPGPCHACEQELRSLKRKIRRLRRGLARGQRAPRRRHGPLRERAPQARGPREQSTIHSYDPQELHATGIFLPTGLKIGSRRLQQQPNLTADSAGNKCAASEQRFCPKTSVVTVSSVELPWSKPLVRTRETMIGNLVASSMNNFHASRCARR
jgi:hypothetical protein